MIRSTQIARIDGLVLTASVDEEQANVGLQETKNRMKQVVRRLNRNSEPQATIESGDYAMHYIIDGELVVMCITDLSFPRKVTFTYLRDLANEFMTNYTPDNWQKPTLRPYAYMEFDSFITKTKKVYQDARASSNLDKINNELQDVTKIMTKNIEDLLYRGDSLERMGDMSQRLREDSKKYKRAAKRINWELLLKQYGPIAAIVFIILFFFSWKFLF